MTRKGDVNWQAMAALTKYEAMEYAALQPSQDSEGSDFDLVEDSCWIAVEDLSIHILKEKNGVHITAYPLHDEMAPEINHMFFPFEEAE